MLKRVSVFCQETGYTKKAVERKIATGVWREGREFVRAPDRRILIDTEAYERWARAATPPTKEPS